jgi:hypothetical protein
MNTKLVNSLVQIIESLTTEERELLDQKLEQKHQINNWQEQQEKLAALQQKIFERREGKAFDPSFAVYIQEGRDELNRKHDELIEQCFKDNK